MKSLIKKLLFRNLANQLFFGVGIRNGRIAESVFLKNGRQSLDVSERHNILCERPFCIAIWVSGNDSASFGEKKLKLNIRRKEKLVVALGLRLIKKLERDNGAILVLEIIKARCHQINLLHQWLLITFFFSNKKHGYKETLIYGALYSYPRRVIVVSYRNNEYYNIFPMDFQGEYPEIKTYLLGLRVSNITVNKIIETKRVVISGTEGVDSKTMYALGAHHSKEPPQLEKLPFGVGESELLKFPVPSFSSSYQEIEVTDHFKLGSHMMFVGRIINSKKLKESQTSLYHIHFFEQLKSDYEEV